MEQATSPPPAAAAPKRRSSFWSEVGRVVVIFGLFAVCTFFGWLHGTNRTPNLFLSADNLVNGVAAYMSIFAIMAVGATFVIISGGIDISVGSIYGLAAICTAWALQYFPIDAPAWEVIPAAAVIAMTIGLACGLVNGLLVVSLRLHPFIVTLGTMSAFRGLTYVLPPAATVPQEPHALPNSFKAVMAAEFGGLRPMSLIIMLLCVAFGAVCLRLMVIGREIYAIGGNEEAARFSGINVARTKLFVYGVSGVTAGLAALVTLGQYYSASTNTGESYELFVIAAAVVGGASLSGGRGAAVGAFLGTLIIQLIRNGIFVIKINTNYEKIVVGIAIVLAAAIDKISEYAAARRIARGR